MQKTSKMKITPKVKKITKIKTSSKIKSASEMKITVGGQRNGKGGGGREMHKDGAEIHTWGAETHRSDSNLGQTPHGWTDRGSYRGGASYGTLRWSRLFQNFQISISH